ncbi:MAG: redoxin domain-containing protein [Chloroflexi bacterium]|nr:redoxin domain-containing protein [Chloroflexota bacterium]
MHESDLPATIAMAPVRHIKYPRTQEEIHVKRHKWHLILVTGLALLLIGSVVSCARSDKVPYAPDFTLKSVNGDTVSLSDFRGKPVMLTFWKIDCPACEFQMPHMQALYAEYQTEEIAMLTVNVGDRATRIQEFIESHGLTLPVLLDGKGRVAKTYGLPGVPMTFLIDSEGIVKAYQIGSFKSREAIESALAQVFPSLTLTPKVEAGPEIGKLAPDFTLQTLDGRSITLSNFRGKTVLLNLWVSSCAACVDEMPYFQIVFDEQTNEGLIILAINCGESSQTVQSIVDGLRLTFPMLLDTDGKICAEYKRGAPTTFLIDGNGIIRAIKDNASESSEEIEGMLDSL